MSKTYKGYELYKMIAEGKIKEGTKFKANQTIVEFDGNNFVLANSERSILFRYADKKVAEMDFELIEDEIDIQQQGINWEEVGQTVGKMYTEFAKGFYSAVEQLVRKSK